MRVNSPHPLFLRNYKWYEFFSWCKIMILSMDIEQLKIFWNKNKFSDFFKFWSRDQISSKLSLLINILAFWFYKLSLYLYWSKLLCHKRCDCWQLSVGATLDLLSLKYSVYNTLFLYIYTFLITFPGLFKRNMWYTFSKRLTIEFYKIGKTILKNLNKEERG